MFFLSLFSSEFWGILPKNALTRLCLTHFSFKTLPCKGGPSGIRGVGAQERHVRAEHVHQGHPARKKISHRKSTNAEVILVNFVSYFFRSTFSSKLTTKTWLNESFLRAIFFAVFLDFFLQKTSLHLLTDGIKVFGMV